MLREQIRNGRQSEGGFTLVELLMVIVILGVLSGIAVFAVNGITDKGDVAACKTNIKTVETAEEAYYATKAAYTEDLSDLVSAGFLHSAPGNVTVKVTPASGTTPASVAVSGACTSPSAG